MFGSSSRRENSLILAASISDSLAGSGFPAIDGLRRLGSARPGPAWRAVVFYLDLSRSRDRRDRKTTRRPRTDSLSVVFPIGRLRSLEGNRFDDQPCIPASPFSFSPSSILFRVFLFLGAFRDSHPPSYPRSSSRASSLPRAAPATSLGVTFTVVRARNQSSCSRTCVQNVAIVRHRNIEARLLRRFSYS